MSHQKKKKVIIKKIPREGRREMKITNSVELSAPFFAESQVGRSDFFLNHVFLLHRVHMDCGGEVLKIDSSLKSMSMNHTYILLSYQKRLRHCGQVIAGFMVDEEIPKSF